MAEQDLAFLETKLDGTIRPTSPPMVQRDHTALRDGFPEVRSGISILAFSTAIGFILGFGSILVLRLDRGTLFLSIEFWIAMICIASAFVLTAASRWEKIGEEQLVKIALVWVVTTSLGIVVAEGWHDLFDAVREGNAQMRGISWTGALLVFFPLVVRTRVRRIVVTALLGAVVGPAFVVLYGAIQGELPPRLLLLRLAVPLLVCGGMAMIPALLIERLRKGMEQIQKLGAYRLEAKLGEGAMGEVWSATHEMLARRAAIKLISPEAMTAASLTNAGMEQALTRFQQEARATAMLESPHTIEVYDFGLTHDRSFFYVMELLEGLDADTLVSRFGPLPVGRAIYLLDQVCHSLEEAHQRGLIHRDVKPANIFVCRRGLEFDFIKVLDFGLVKDIQTRSSDTPKLTSEGMAPGTPATISPEVALGKATIDARSDLYSLGCVAYFLVTGRYVFEDETAMAVMVKQVHEEPEPPSKFAPRELPPRFEELIMRTLAKDPDERPQSARELQLALRECTTAVWNAEHAREWWQENCPDVGELPELRLTGIDQPEMDRNG